MEFFYIINILSVLEFKKDIFQKDICIFYGKNYEVVDLYVIFCDIENIGKKVIKN